MNFTKTEKAGILIPACILLALAVMIMFLPEERILPAALLLFAATVIYLIILFSILKRKAAAHPKPHEEAGFKNARTYTSAVSQKSYIKGNVSKTYHNVHH